MEFVLGIIVGAVAALVIAAAAVLIILRRMPEGAQDILGAPENSPSVADPAVTVQLVETFINQQLREVMSEEARAANTPPGATDPFAAMKISVKSAAMDLQPGGAARLLAELVAPVLRWKVTVYPVTDMRFVPVNGRVRVAITNVQVGGINIPRALVDRFVTRLVQDADERLNHSLEQLRRDTGVTLASIETTDDLLVLKFNGRAAAPTVVDMPVVTVQGEIEGARV